MTDQPTEAQCQSTIVQAARTLGYLVHHTRPAYRKSGRISTPIQGDAGFPDLVIAGHGRLWFAELKRKGNKPTEHQRAWQHEIIHAVVSGHAVKCGVLIVPDHQQQFIDMLVKHAKRSKAS